jgi:short subunit dehydrogenase-like uncharacterized protein
LQRDNEKVKQCAAEVAAKDYIAFGLEDTEEILRMLGDVCVFANCAGPFVHTFQHAARGCIAAGVHYIDITGEVDVFEAAKDLDAAATAAKVALIPGCGIDVVPTDCLAAAAAKLLPSADHLELAFAGLGPGKMSVGTATTVLTHLQSGGQGHRRVAGEMESIPLGSISKSVDFGPRAGVLRCDTAPTGDVVTSFHATRIPNIDMYYATPWWLSWATYLGSKLCPMPRLLRNPFVFSIAKAGIVGSMSLSGPTESARRSERCYCWARVSDSKTGRQVVMRSEVREGYEFTAAAVVAATAILVSQGPSWKRYGFLTPSMAFGDSFVQNADPSSTTTVVG